MRFKGRQERGAKNTTRVFMTSPLFCERKRPIHIIMRNMKSAPKMVRNMRKSE
jgi:hypothetical protein